MKRTHIGNLTLKIILPLLALVLAMASCHTDKNSMSEEEAVELTQQSMSTKSGGMVDQMELATDFIEASLPFCGTMFDSVVVRTNTPGAAITYHFTHNWTYGVLCSGGQPSEFDLSISGSSVYDAPRMSSNDNVSLTCVVTGLEQNSFNYIYNGSYTRNGTQQSHIHNQKKFASIISITGTTVTVSKSSKEITSGTATVGISAESNSGQTSTFNGNITFLGNSQAQLVVNGNTYTLEW